MADSAPGSSVGGSRAGSKCTLVEVVQFDCIPGAGNVVSCEPIERIFRKCAGRPMVEVTHVVQFDHKACKWYLPAHLKEAMPTSYHWHEVP